MSQPTTYPPKPNKHNHSHGVSQPTARNTQPTQSWHTQLRQSTSTIATLFVYACTLTEHMPPYPTHMVFDVVRDSGYVCFSPRAVGAVVAHFPDTEGVTSSNLVSPTRLHTVHCLCGHSLVGKARPCQGRDRGFESRCPLSFSHCSRRFMPTPLRIGTWQNSGTLYHFTVYPAPCAQNTESGVCSRSASGS